MLWGFFCIFRGCIIYYILYSKSMDCYYIGHTANLEGRLRRHNSEHKGYTGKASDWSIVYSEAFSTKEQAHQREMQIKS
jgi:putative endonuclease